MPMDSNGMVLMGAAANQVVGGGNTDTIYNGSSVKTYRVQNDASSTSTVTVYVMAAENQAESWEVIEPGESVDVMGVRIRVLGPVHSGTKGAKVYYKRL